MELPAGHRPALNVRGAYRINAVILLGQGRTAADNAAAQKQFLHDDDNPKKTSETGDVVMFMDAPRPQHNRVIGNGWIKRGEDYPTKSNTG